jgi:type VI secretion system protein ImpK
LNQVGGQVLITGYTDSIPIQNARFPSNYHLSQERAEAVQKMIDPRLTTP